MITLSNKAADDIITALSHLSSSITERSNKAINGKRKINSLIKTLTKRLDHAKNTR